MGDRPQARSRRSDVGPVTRNRPSLPHSGAGPGQGQHVSTSGASSDSDLDGRSNHYAGQRHTDDPPPFFMTRCRERSSVSLFEWRSDGRSRERLTQVDWLGRRRTTTTEQGAYFNTFSATLPSCSRSVPSSPRDPTTIISARTFSAWLKMASLVWPVTTCVVTEQPVFISRSR